MRMIIIPLFFLVFACIFGALYNLSVTGGVFGSDLGSGNAGYGDDFTFGDYSVNGTLSEDGSPTEIGFDSGSATISFSLSGLAIALLVNSLALGAVVGIRFVGSGLSEFSVKSIVVISVCMSVWLIFSAYGITVFDEIPYFGLPLYFFLSLIYIFGVFQEIWI